MERWEDPLLSRPADEIPELCFCLLFELLLLPTSLFGFKTQTSPLHSYLFDSLWSDSAKQLKMFGIKAMLEVYGFEICWRTTKLGKRVFLFGQMFFPRCPNLSLFLSNSLSVALYIAFANIRSILVGSNFIFLILTRSLFLSPNCVCDHINIVSVSKYLSLVYFVDCGKIGLRLASPGLHAF